MARRLQPRRRTPLIRTRYRELPVLESQYDSAVSSNVRHRMSFSTVLDPLARALQRRASFMLVLLTFLCATAQAITVSSQDFGQVQIATAFTLNISIPTVTPGPAALSLRYSIDFSVGACTANANGCALSVTFNPTKPGLRQDAVMVKDANGLIVEEIFLHGIGLGPLPVFSPAPATLKAQMPVGDCQFGATAAEPNGKILIVGDFLGSVFEFDPSTNSLAAVAGLPASGSLNGIYAPAVDAAGNIYYTNATSGLHRYDAVTQTDAVFAANVNAAGLIVDPSGNLFYEVGNQVFELNPNTKAVTLVAGNGTKGFKGDGGPAMSAEFNTPAGLAFDLSGNLYVADSLNQRVRKVDTSGNITTMAGTGTSGLTGDGGPALSAELASPSLLVTDAAGDLYAAMSSGQVRRIDAGTGLISTIAGATPETAVSSIASDPFLAVGFSASAQDVSVSGGMSLDNAGNLWIAGNALYEVTPAALPLQFPFAAAGISQTQTLSLLNGGTATLNQPVITKTGPGAADFSTAGTCTNSLAKGVTCNLSVTFVAGAHPTSVAAITLADNALSSPQTIAISGASGGILPTTQQITAVAVGNSSASPQTVSIQFPGVASGVTAKLVYGSEFKLGQLSCSGTATVSCTVPVTFTPLYPGPRQDAIQFLDSTGVIVYQCFLNATGQAPQWFIDPGGSIGTFQISSSLKLSAVDPAGNLYAVPAVGLPTSGEVYRFNTQSSQWTLVAGQSLGGVDTGDGGPATSATLTYVNAVAFDSAGDMFIAESSRIRRVDAHSGIIATISQQGGDSIAVNPQGYVFIGNSRDGEVFMLNPATGAVTVYAGNGTLASTGDGGLATAASLNEPSALTFDTAGNLFIAESLNVRKVTAATGIITTYASFCGTSSLAFDAAGDLYLSCGDLAIIPAGPGTPYFPQNPTLTDVFSPILRTPAGTFYTSDGVTLTPALASPLSAAETFSLMNAGNASLALNSITLTGTNAAAFSQTNSCGQSLTPAQACSVNLTFPAAQQQALLATLNVTSSLAALQSTLDLPGTLPVLQVTPITGLNFGDVALGITVQTSLSLDNQSPILLTIAGISISGPNASDFTITANCPASLIANQTCTAIIAFHPIAAGARSATLTITDNALGSPQVVALSGTAFGPKPKAVWSSWYPTKTAGLRANDPPPTEPVFANVAAVDAPLAPAEPPATTTVPAQSLVSSAPRADEPQKAQVEAPKVLPAAAVSAVVMPKQAPSSPPPPAKKLRRGSRRAPRRVSAPQPGRPKTS